MSQNNSKSADSGTSLKQSIEDCCDTTLTKQVDQILTKVKGTYHKAFADAVGFTKAHPDKALIYATTTGYALRVMPLARVIGGVVRLAVPLVKPAVVFYGISRAIKAMKR